MLQQASGRRRGDTLAERLRGVAGLQVLRARTREGGGDAELRHLLNVLQGEA